MKYNQNCLKKFENEQEDEFNNELKRFQQERIKQNRTEKDAFKRVCSSFIFILLKSSSRKF